MSLVDIVGRSIAITSAVVLLAGAAQAGETWREDRVYKTKDGNDSVVMYTCERNGNEVRKTNVKTGEWHLVYDDGHVLGSTNSYHTSEANPGMLSTEIRSGSTREATVITYGKNENNPAVQPLSSSDDDAPTIDVRVDGYSFGSKGKSDLEEATVDAMRKAIEKGTGISIESFTNVENFILQKDQIKTRANGVLLSGYEVVVIGYGPMDSRDNWDNRTLKVTLIGKARGVSPKAQKEYDIGGECYDNKDYNCAKEHFEKAVSLDNNNTRFIFSLAQTYKFLGKDFFDKALKNYYICIESDHRKGDAYASIGGIFGSRFYHGQNKEKAYEAWKKGAELGNSFCKKNIEDFENICKEENMK